MVNNEKYKTEYQVKDGEVNTILYSINHQLPKMKFFSKQQ